MLRLGAHLSAAGGPDRAVAAARSLGCGCLQLFLRSPGRWAGRQPSPATVARFRSVSGAAALDGACFAHAPYLLNLASADAELRRRSAATLVEELETASTLGLAGVVLHPGSAGDGRRGDGEARCRDALEEVLAAAGDGAPLVVLEVTAGGGGQLGRGPAELARLVPTGRRRRVGICVDTAHAWAAGYDLADDGLDALLDELGEHWELAAPDLLHGNDTAVALGSRRDRHLPPGEGVLGEGFFRRVLADPRLDSAPLVVEIPPGPGNALARASLDRLRAWAPRACLGDT